MLILQRKVGESLVIGEDITISVVAVDGSRVRLAISAPENVSILRSELVTATATNLDSAMEEAAPAALLDLLGGMLEGEASRQLPGDSLKRRPVNNPSEKRRKVE